MTIHGDCPIQNRDEVAVSGGPGRKSHQFRRRSILESPPRNVGVTKADATEFETEAASLVYRKGNLERMNLALEIL
jgi:hypothetical protein